MVVELNAKILEIRHETHDTKTFKFEVPADFTFKPGQFMMFGAPVGEKIETKAFTISSSPTRKGYIEITKKMSESPHSKSVANLKEGDTALIKGPYGVFTFREEEMNTVVLAGGIGVTPFRCYIQYVVDKGLPNNITMFYSNKTTEDIAFQEELDNITKSHPNIKVVNTITRPEQNKKPWSGLTGRVDINMIKNHCDINTALFYTCGPLPMINAVIEMLQAAGIPRNRIRMEEW